MFSTNSDGTLVTMFNKKSLTWKEVKKLKKSGKVLALRFFEDGFWNTMKQLKIFITDSIRTPTNSFIQQTKAINEPKPTETIEKIEPSEETIEKIEPSEETIMSNICNNFYTLLHLKCTEYKVSPPIILYGRLFEEECFQYISFIFGQRVLIIEISTDYSDTQERACETICALIRKCGGIPKVSTFIKVQNNVAHIVAEINMQNENFTLCESIPDDLEIFNLNEINDLIMASHYLANISLTSIKENCVETLFYKQPFLERYHTKNNRIFGCVNPAEKNTLQSQHQIILVLCDTYTQSNFLWNDKPLTVTTKRFTCDVNYMAPKMPYQRIELKPVNVSSSEPGGIRFGDQILYDGPFDVIFD